MANANAQYTLQDGYNKINNLIRRHTAPVIRANINLPKWNDFNINNNNELIFTPLNLIVLEDLQQKQQALTAFYNNNENIGLGILAFYGKFRRKYAGITRDECAAFLREQPQYQLTFKQAIKRVQKKVFGHYPNEKWAIDLLSLESYVSPQNRNRRFLLVGIDYFSHKAFLVAIPNRTRQHVINALNDVVQNQMGNTFPSVLICDNGAEFQLDAWCNQNHITLQHTQPAAPKQNALVEQLNRTVRQYIKAVFIRNGNHIWINCVPDMINHLNSRKISSLKYSPNELWHAGRVAIQQVPLNNSIVENQNEKQWRVLQKIKGEARQVVANLANDALVVGDFVRIRTDKQYVQVRTKLKSEIDRKSVVISWSPEIYTISRVIASRNPYTPTRYECTDRLNNIVRKEFVMTRPNQPRPIVKFMRYDLQKISNTIPTATTRVAGHRLNKTTNIILNDPL